MLENIPEFSTLWNWRRNILISIFSTIEETVFPDNLHDNVNNTAEDCVPDKESVLNFKNRTAENLIPDLKAPDMLVPDSDILSDQEASGTNTKIKPSNDKEYLELLKKKSKMIEDEKDFVVRCLRTNPKAYSLWNHRRWLLEQNLTSENIKTEISLCNQFFQLDDRNFHCWDYRRFVVKIGDLSEADELDKTTSLIECNFSNYSAWHYRSTLLCGGVDKNRDNIEESVIRREHEWTENAYFTDPADQSVWLYHQWLLGRKHDQDRMLSATLYDSPTSGNSLLVILFEKLHYQNPSVTLFNDEKIPSQEFLSPSVPSRVWYTIIPTNVSIHQLRYNGEVLDLRLNDTSMIGEAITPRRDFAAPNDIVMEQLKNIRELHELEDGNKWCMLTLANMMNTLYPLKSAEQIQEIRCIIVKLCHVDTGRIAYYRDLWSRILSQTAVESWWHEKRVLERPSSILNLSGKYLSYLAFTDYFHCVRELDLSHNQLTNLWGFGSLILLQNLKVSHNKIYSLEGIEQCKHLTCLDMSHNNIRNTCNLLPATKCRISQLNLLGNPIVSDDVYPGCVTESFVMITHLDGKQL